jgi:ribosomal protein L11 methyltransferase
VIEDRCVIHSTFHHDYPQAEYDIVIKTQMKHLTRAYKAC